jgi:hypothetical protein
LDAKRGGNVLASTGKKLIGALAAAKETGKKLERSMRKTVWRRPKPAAINEIGGQTGKQVTG